MLRRLARGARAPARAPALARALHAPVVGHGALTAEELQIRAALGIGRTAPVLACNALDRDSVKSVLLTLLGEVLDGLDAAAANG
jgi:hypothetical protein